MPTSLDSGRTNTLSRDLSEFLLELSVAMHKHAIYPKGHPLLAQAVDEVHRGLNALLADRGALSIGVARKQLIIEGVATESTHPLLGELAGKLHRHHIGAVKFTRGVSREEIGSALSVVGLEAQKDEQPLGMRADLADAQWPNIKLFPLTYERLELLDDDDDGALAADRGASGGGGRAAQLWVGLATAAIASDTKENAPMEPEQVAAAIDQHDREPAYDQVIVGYLLQIAREVRDDDTPVTASAGLKRRISKLVGSLQPKTLRRLLEMGGDDTQRRNFLLDATQGMNVDAVIDLVQAAASAEGQTISSSMVRMLTKLATHASGERTVRSETADGEFRENVSRLIASWSLDDPNPLAYSAALEQLSRTGGDSAARDVERFPCEATRTVAMALELNVTGVRVSRAVATALQEERLGELLDLLENAPAEHSETIAYAWMLIQASDPLGAVLAAPKLDHQLARRLVPRLGTAATAPLLGALETTAEGARRDRILGYLASLDVGAAPLVASRLSNASPSIARDLLATLGKLAPPSPPAAARAFLTHDDALLRREAVRLLLGYDETRESAMALAARDEDERVVYAALLAAQEKCPPGVASTIRQRIDRGELPETATRAAAIRAAANIRDEETLDWLIRRAVLPGGLLRRARLAPTSPEVLAALTAIAARWSDHPKSLAVLEQARASASSTVRMAVQPGAARVVEERGRTT